ncbi:MAG: NAD(P)/FAD-dependent oxidoreductase [Acidiferrobacterales bacterium]
MSEVLVVVGAGHCAGQAVASLRQEGFDGEIFLVGEEPHIPYQRPPLSKKYLARDLPIERVYLRPAKFYQDNGIELVLGHEVVTIHRNERCVVLADGKTLRYDKLLLATGSAPRRLDVPGANLPGVCYLRSIPHADHIQTYMGRGKRMVVIGGGYIGLEVSSIGAQKGMHVTVLEMADRILNRVTAPEMSAFFEQLHREQGVDIRCNVQIQRLEGSDNVEAVLCDGKHIEADIVIVGIGILPNVELAKGANLECDNGIVVDEYCRTGDENILAAGDCTNHPNPLLQRRLRLESVNNAVEQAKTAAANLCGRRQPYAEIPWFWSDQYDVKLQIVGLSNGYDQVVQRGDMEDKSFSLFYLRDGMLIAVDAVNNPREYMACKKLIAQRLRIPLERLANTAIPMQEMA